MSDEPPTGEGFQAVVDWFMRNGDLFGTAVLRARAVHRWAYTTPHEPSKFERLKNAKREAAASVRAAHDERVDRITAGKRASWEGLL